MNKEEFILYTLGSIMLLAPMALLLFFFIYALRRRRPSEAIVGGAVQSATATGLLAALGAAILMLIQGRPQFVISIGDWVITSGYHLKFQFVLDVLSLSYVILTFLLCTIIAAFSTRYLHRENGYVRFFVLFSIFLLGMLSTAMADTCETLFVGWELVGLSSVFLIAFFHERPSPPRNGWRVWIVYRVSDAALMLAAVMMHEINGAGDFDHIVGIHAWPEHGPLSIGPHFGWLGLLFVIAAAGKSALLPFSGWLPRAMEGPTPSSAIFYGALSVHLGAFLLLRISPILDSNTWLAWVVVVLGFSTAGYAYLVGRVQTDIKSALAFASLVQVGLIVAEIGLGFRYLALIHLLGHACLRTLQFLRAPSLLHDQHQLEDAIGLRPAPESASWDARFPLAIRLKLYQFSIERGYLDFLLEKFITRPFILCFGWIDRSERALADRLDGHHEDTPSITEARSK